MKFCAEGSILASLCDEYDKSSPVPISDIAPKIFRQMLYYAHGGKISTAEWKYRSKDFIDTADKFGLHALKIEAEAWYVEHLILTVDDVVEALIYADDKDCALLKEAAMDFMLKNAKEVLVSDSFERIPESKTVMRELMLVASMKKQDDAKKDREDHMKLSINDLRAKLNAKGEDVDGPRETLICRLT